MKKIIRRIKFSIFNWLTDGEIRISSLQKSLYETDLIPDPKDVYNLIKKKRKIKK